MMKRVRSNPAYVSLFCKVKDAQMSNENCYFQNYL